MEVDIVNAVMMLYESTDTESRTAIKDMIKEFESDDSIVAQVMVAIPKKLE